MLSETAIVLLWIPLGLAGAASFVIAAAPPAWLAAHSQQNNSSAAQSRGQVAPDDDGGVFVFKKKVEEVVLHASVVDNKNRMVMDLGRDAFTVYENNKPQTVISFRREDAPVAMGIVIDNSGSMREKRDKVNTAALDLVLSSNPQDRVFVVNFNDEPYLDQDFTSDIGLLKHALERVDARGNTALYDAVVGAAERLELAQLSKKVLFVVTDGEG
jgi:VWFA-related protein